MHMSKYHSIKLVNDWRKNFNRPTLPNYQPLNTIYYDKLSLYLRSRNVVNYDFAMAAFLFEMSNLQVFDLNRIYVDRFANSNIAYYNQKRDLAIINTIFDNKVLERYVMLDRRKDYDSMQKDVYSSEEWNSSVARELERIAITNEYSQSSIAVLQRKIDAEAKRRFGSSLMPATNLYSY